MGKRIALLILVGGVSSMAFGSFELLLVADNGANTIPTRRIHRFDPDSGVYLGAFGNFSSDIKAMTIRQSRNEAIVTAGLTTYVFDYNTGALKRDFASLLFTDIAVSQDDTYIYAVQGSNIIYRTTTAAMDAGTFTPTAFITEALTTTQITSIATTVTGTLVAGQNRAGSFFTYRYDPITGVGTQSSAFTPPGTIGASENIMGGGSLQAFTFGGNGRAVRYSNAGFQTGSIYVAPGISTATAVSAAHTGAYIVGIDAVTPTQGLVTRLANSGAEMQSFGGSVLRKPVAMSSVLAPEPGTMIALGAGVVALLRRRRKARTQADGA